MENIIIDEHIMTEFIEKDIREHGEKVPPLRIPKDKYFLCHLVFFLLGIIHFLPMSFFSAAMNFWMYKFRNLSDPTMSSGNRTGLQTHFASTQMIVNTVPMLLLGIWNVSHGHKFKIMNRIIYTMVIQVLIYYIFTAFVKINTDSYETGFFVIVMVCWGTLTGSNIINVVASTLLFPRFPHTYMKTSMLGEGVAGILGDILNIISVAAFDDVRDATLMYFIFGSVVVTATLILTIMISKTEFFMHCVSSIPEDTKAGIPPRKDIFNALAKIKLTIFMAVTMVIGVSASHTSITALVVSEQDTGKWAETFFTPVLTFFWTDCCGMIGRFLATHSPLQNLPDAVLCGASIARTLILVPLIWFCNAQPRSHLSVLFPHDYQYAIIVGLFVMLNGYLMNMGMLLVPKKTNKQEAQIAYVVFSLVMGVFSTAASPIGMFIVDIL